MTILATIRTYDELNAALRKRADELNVSRRTIDGIAGLPTGYAEKLLAPIPIRILSRMSLGAMLGALGLKLIVVEDIETLKKIEARLTKRRRRADASDTMLATKRKKRRAYLRGCSEWGTLMNARRLSVQTPEQRARIARRAAVIRWKRQKEQRRTQAIVVTSGKTP